MPSATIGLSDPLFGIPGGSAGAARANEGFASPWYDQATAAMPTNFKNALQWCEYIWHANGTYRMAMERIIAYFLTDLEIGSGDPRDSLGDDEKEKWESYLHNTLNILGATQDADRDCSCYGNALLSMMVPFRRMLSCPKCKNMWPLAAMSESPVFNASFTNGNFVASCPKCRVGSGYRGEFRPVDLPDNLEQKLRIKSWNVHQMEIVHDMYTGDNAYFWRIPEDYKRKIRQGDLHTLERAPLQVIKAVQNNMLFKFAPGVIFHMREPTLCGILNRGWGLPRTLINFRDIWYVQVLRRYNEAIALDYVIPFRVITPMPRPGSTTSANDAISTDPLMSYDMADFSPQVMRMIAKRRRNPANWNVLPFPIQYQALGGEASQLAPAELINQGYDTLLNSSGVPTDLYKGTLQLQTAPVALRLFEATHHSLVHNNNAMMRWVVQQTMQLLNWEMITAKMKRVTHADDFQKQMAQLQLMMGQTISQTSGLKALGMDWKDEQRLIAEEARYQAQLQADVQEEMEQASFGEQMAKGQAPGVGGAPAGGAAGGGAPQGGAAGGMGMPPGPVTGMEGNQNTPTTPMEMMEEASGLAQQILTLPESQRRSEMKALQQKNKVLWSLVRAQMDTTKNQARTAGAAMLMGQQGAAPQQAAA
jgi:hypothetical protein